MRRFKKEKDLYVGNLLYLDRSVLTFCNNKYIGVIVKIEKDNGCKIMWTKHPPNTTKVWVNVNRWEIESLCNDCDLFILE